MKIAVVGGGGRCKNLMRLIERHTFLEINPRVIAVADLKSDAPGYLKAESQGLYVTHDYNDFFERDDIDLIIELTDSMEIYNDILSKKSRTVRAISARTAKLFEEIASVSTLQKKVSQELHETKALYQLVFNDLIQEDVVVISYDYRILDINESMLNRLGLKREEVIGQPCYKVTHRQDSPCSGEHHPCPLVQTLETEKPSQTTHIHHDKDNREIYYSISTYPLIEHDDVIGAIEISRDITKDISLQKMMMQQEKLASVGRLSAGVAHEINNPLTTILTTAMLIQEDINSDDPMNEELETIANEALRCRKIVSSLLDFARQRKPKKEINDINKIIMESILLINKQAAFNDIVVDDKLAEDLPRVRVDKGQIQQALINLALNAIEATDPGGLLLFTTRYIAEDRQIEIAVRDSGSGISSDIIDKIFDPFFTTKEDGNGLGLAITHGILEQHGGKLGVESQLGEGSRFSILLPVDAGKQHAETI